MRTEVTEPLANPADLIGLLGAPFHESAVTAAAASIRRHCQWHIAPEITQTVRVRTGGADVAWLPTLALVEVVEIRDTRTGQVLALPWWDVPGFGLETIGRWPELIDVEMKHGFNSVPAELLPVIATRARESATGRIRSESLGGRGIALATDSDTSANATLAALTIPRRP